LGHLRIPKINLFDIRGFCNTLCILVPTVLSEIGDNCFRWPDERSSCSYRPCYPGARLSRMHTNVAGGSMDGFRLEHLDLSGTSFIRIGSYICQKCPWLRDVLFPATLREIGVDCFRHSGLEAVDFSATRLENFWSQLRSRMPEPTRGSVSSYSKGDRHGVLWTFRIGGP
jgi:hypothetical protein